MGLRAAWSRQRRRARGHARVRPALGGIPAHDAAGVGRGGRPPSGPDGQLGGRPPDHRLRADPLPGPDAGEQGDRGPARSSRAPSSGRRSSAATASTCSGSSPPAGSTRTSITCARCSASHRRRPGSTLSPTAVTSRRTRPSATSPSCPPIASPRSPAATTRWTATGAGSGPSGRYDADRRLHPRDGVGPRGVRAAELRRRRDRRVPRARPLRGPARGRAGRRGDLLQLPTRPRPPALAAAARAGLRPDDDDPLPGRPRLPGRVRGAGGREHARGGARRSGCAPAPLRGDGEVRARHLLLQRRPGGGVAGRDAGSSSPRRGRSEPTTGSRRCRLPRSPPGSRPRSASGYRFGIVNFANPDMVGHTGSIPAAIAAVETADRCLGEVVEAVERAGEASRSSRPTTETPRRCSRPTASARTRRTRRIRSRWSSPARAAALAAEGELSDLAPDQPRPARYSAAGRDDRPQPRKCSVSRSSVF